MIKYTCGAGTPEEAETNCTYFIRGECTASFCEYRRKKQTNADRIRAMSDEELVGFLMRLMGHEQCFAEGIFPYHPCPQSHSCKQCGIDWLQQPAEEERK